MSAAPGLVPGTHVYPAAGDAGDRMRRALDGWTTLSGVRLVNLQFAGDPPPALHPAFHTCAVLREDSRSVSGVQGVRRPTMREMLDRLVDEADRAGGAYGGFSNADILVSQAAIDGSPP